MARPDTKSWIYAESTSHLVWAVRVTADSYTRGLIRHRICLRPMAAFRTCVARERDSRAAMGRVPPEIVAGVESHLRLLADVLAENVIKERTWDRRKRKRDLNGTSSNQPSSSYSSGVSTSDEFIGIGEDSSEEEFYLGGMEERARFFKNAYLAMMFRRGLKCFCFDEARVISGVDS
jgi:hypothetical protein